MELKEIIYRRKSVRSYTNEPVDDVTLQKIEDFVAGARHLYPDIKVKMEIATRDQVKCICPWKTPQLITIFSEEKEGYLENAGFIFQQLDLYLQSIGLGVCWLGMGKIDDNQIDDQSREDGLNYVIMLSFGHPKGKALRDGKSDFKRKTQCQIADVPDEKLEPARFAPSSVNSQPWYFTHEGDYIHVYCVHKGVLTKKLGNTNQLDVGIALAHMYVANERTFEFIKIADCKQLKDHTYIGSFTI